MDEHLRHPAPKTISDLASGKATTQDVRGAAKAAGTIAFSGQPTADDIVTINGVIFTAKDSGATGNQFNIGEDLGATIDNLVTVLEASAETGVAAATYSNVSDTTLKIVHDTVGDAGNAFTLDASVATPSGDTLIGGSDADVIDLDANSVINLYTVAAAVATVAEVTLPDGADGQTITVGLKVKGANATIQLNGTFDAGNVSLTFDNAGEFTRLQFLYGAWQTIANNSGAFA